MVISWLRARAPCPRETAQPCFAEKISMQAPGTTPRGTRPPRQPGKDAPRPAGGATVRLYPPCPFVPLLAQTPMKAQKSRLIVPNRTCSIPPAPRDHRLTDPLPRPPPCLCAMHRRPVAVRKLAASSLPSHRPADRLAVRHGHHFILGGITGRSPIAVQMHSRGLAHFDRDRNLHPVIRR